MPRNVHPIPFIIRPSDEFAKNIDLRNLSRSLATKYADGHVVTDDDLQIMGRNLWNGLSADAQGAFETARKEAGEKILPVVIHNDAADVQALPWETLFHPTYGFIGKNPDFTLTRRSSAQEATGELEQGPLRVLLFTSLPANVDSERSHYEFRIFSTISLSSPVSVDKSAGVASMIFCKTLSSSCDKKAAEMNRRIMVTIFYAVAYFFTWSRIKNGVIQIA